MPSIGDITGRIVIQDTGSPSALKFGENLDKLSKTITASMSRATLATETAVRDIAAKLNALKSQTKATDTGKGLLSDLQAVIKKRQEEIVALKTGPAAIEALNRKRFEEAQALKIAAAQVEAGISAESDLGKEIAKNIRTLDKYEHELSQVAKAQAIAAQKAEQQVAAYRKMSDVGSTLTARVTLPLVGLAAVSFKTSTDLNRSLANVSALLTDLTGDDLNAAINSVKSNIQSLAPELGKSTGDLAEGFYEVVSSLGYTRDSFGQLEIAARAGAAGLATTQESINFLTAVTKTYGDTSERAFKQVADLGFQAVNIGQTTFPQLAASIGGVAPVAQAAGVSLEEMFAVIATATGVTGNTSEVTNQMAAAITALLSPSEQLKGMYKELKVNSGEAMIAEYGLVGSLQKVAQYSEAAKIPIIELLGRKEAFIITASLAGAQAKTFAGNLDKMGQAAKANGAIVTDAFDKQTKGINRAGFQYEQAKVKLEVLSQRLGDQLAPAIVKVIDKITSMVEMFSELPAPIKGTLIVIGSLAAAIGPLLFVTGQLLLSWRQIMVLGPKLVNAINSVSGAMTAIRLAMLGVLAVGIYAFLDTIIRKWGEAQTAVTNYNLEVAKVEGAALGFARQVAQGALSSTVSKNTFDEKLKEAETLGKLIVKATADLEVLKAEGLKASAGRVISGNFKSGTAQKEQELKNLWAAYSKLRSALADVTIAGEKVDDTLGAGTNPFGGLITSSKEALNALKSIEDMITALERQQRAEESLFATIERGPEAYHAQQRANEIDLKIQEARNTLAEQGLSLSAEMEARIRSAVGAIFDLGTATEKLNAVISAANSLYQTSITNIGALAEAVKAVKLESTTQNIVSLSKAFLDSDLNISKMKAALSLLNPESDLAKKLAHQLAIETDALTSAYDSNAAAIKQRTLSIAEASRHSEDLIRRELSAIRERNAAMLKGAGSLATLERQRDIAAETSRILADLKPNLGTETIEEFAARWLKLAKEIRTELETEYKIEIAADLKASLETPSEALQKYLALIHDLSHAVDTSGKAILTATEAEELRTRAVLAYAEEILSNASNVFGELADMFAGFFDYLANAADTLERAMQMQSKTSALAIGMGASAGAASALGAFGAYLVIAKAMYDAFKTSQANRQAQKYNTGAAFSKDAGQDWNTPVQGQALIVSHQIQRTAEAFAEAIGGAIKIFADLEIQVRRDGKYYAAIVEGEMIGHFASMAEATSAALLEAFKSTQTTLTGISDLVRSGLAYLSSGTGDLNITSLEDAGDFLAKLREISELTWSDNISSTLEAVRHFDTLRDTLEKLGESTEQVTQGFNDLTGSEVRAWQDLFDSITGRQRSAAEIRADKEKELAVAKAELEIRKAAIGQRILEAKAQIEALKAGNAFIGGGGKGRAGGGGILGVATAFAIAGEALIGVSAAVVGTISAESEAMIALLEKEIAGLEELLKALGALDIPDIGKIGGGKGSGIKDLRDDIRKQIAQLAAESKGPLHAAFYNFEQSIRDFIARAKEAKLPADELAKGIELLTAAFRKGLLDSARDRAGLDSDFTKRLRDTQQFFDELEALGRKNTGIPDWLRKWMEGQAFEKLGSELLAMIGEFGGLVDPMLAINMRAAELRQNVIAFAEAAGWSSEQIQAAMDAIEAGAQYQRQQGINSVLDRLFGYLKQAGLFQKEAQEFERQKALTDLVLLEAQLRFYGALTEQTQAWIDAAREFVLSPGFGGNNGDDVQKVRVVNSGNDWDEIVEKIKSLVDDWRQAVKQFADSTAALMTDDQLSNLTQAEQLAFAKSQVEDLAAKAQAGDIDALAKLEAARAEYLKELRESEGAGFGFDKGWDWVMGLTADVLENAQDAENNMIAVELAKTVEAWAYVMDKLAQQLEAAFYLNTQDLIDAIYNAIGGVPGFASGGVVMRGPRIVRVAEYIPEAIVPLDRLASMVPYPKVGDGMISGGNRSRQDARSDFYRSLADRDALARLSSVEITSTQTARALASIKNDISAIRRRT